MGRQLRLDYPGALFHVTSRGNNKWSIFLDDVDRVRFLELFATAIDRYGWIVTAYVLMTNHFHVFFELTRPTLSRGMKWLNSQYARWFNKRHDRVGHLFQRRFCAELVEKEAYLLNVMRYVVLNPVRAHMVDIPEQYRWSSYRATAGLVRAPKWLAVDDALRCFAPSRSVAQGFYKKFVFDGIKNAPNPWDDLVAGTFLGTKNWVDDMRERLESQPRDSEYAAGQRRLKGWEIGQVVESVSAGLDLPEALVTNTRAGKGRLLTAWLGAKECLLTLNTIAAGLRLRSAGHVSRLVRDCDRRLAIDAQLRKDLERCRSALYAV